MSLNHRELVRGCVEALDTFDPAARAIEEHVNKYLKHQKGLGEADQTFIVEVFSGIIRYNDVLRVVLNGFFNRDGKTVLRSEENIYQVISYLALFRLDELGMAHFQKFVRGLDVNKMYKFLNFFSDDKHLRTWMKDEWSRLYEPSFVQTSLLSPILRWHPELRELVDQLKKRIDNKLKLKKNAIPATEIKAFKLTQPRPRSVTMPEPIPVLQKHRPVPKTLYDDPVEQDVMSQIKEANRRKAEERLMEASRIQFACANPEKSDKTKEKIRAIVSQEEGKLDFERHKSNPVPHGMLSDNKPIKLNAAAILREGKLYKKREQDELRKLEQLEAGARDGSEFREWQNKMKHQDLNAQLADIERRRIEGKLSHEEAILARQNLVEENKQKVQEMKIEAEKLMQEFLERKLIEEQQMRDLVGQVMDTHENAKDAKKKLQEYKARIVQEVVEESRELMRQALEEAEREMQRRMELIRQIRAMEAVPVIRQKLVDLSETSGHGLLSEMSIAELRERLALLKMSEEAEEEDRRDSILNQKEAKDQMLMDTLQTISRHRTEQSKAAAIRLEERKKTRLMKPEIKDEKISELQRKLEERKAQRKREQEKSKLVPDRKSIHRLKELNASKHLMEEGRWQELEQRRERTAKLGTSGAIKSSSSASRIANRQLVVT